MQGDGEQGLQSVHSTSPLPLLLAHTVPLLQCGVPPFINSSSMGPLHRMQSSSNRLLQCRCPTGHSSCQKTHSNVGSSPPAPARSLLQCGTPTPCSFLQDTSTCCGVCYPWAVVCTLHGLWCAYLLQCVLLWVVGGQPTSPWSSSRSAGESLPSCQEHLLPSFFIDHGACIALSFTFSPSSLSLTAAVQCFFSLS